jgi:BASS family bile acid:Na+ symporter
MDSLITVFLPLSLAVIMFSLGLGLTIDDFKRIATRPKAFAVGAFSQLVTIPVVAYVLAVLFKLPPELALGLMILSLCPGGVTSNLLTKLALGDLALAISLTGITSLVAVAMFANQFMGPDAPPINVTRLGVSMFVITAAPVVIGLLVRHLAPGFAKRAEPVLDKLAAVLFVIVVIGALAANWRIFIENLAVFGPVVVLLNVILLAIGLLLGRLFALGSKVATAISIETGVQNATLGITVGSLIVEQASALPPFSLPSAIYGIIMYGVTIPFVYWRRKQTAATA